MPLYIHTIKVKKSKSFLSVLIYSIRSGHYTSLRPLLCKKPQPNWTLWWPWLDATIVVISGNLWARLFFDQAMQEGRGIRSITPRAPIMCTITLGDTPPLRPLPSQLWESQFSPPPPSSNSSIQKIGKCPSEVVPTPTLWHVATPVQWAH